MIYGTFYTVRDHANGTEWTTEYFSLEAAREGIRRCGLKYAISVDENYRGSDNIVHFKGSHKAE